MEKERIAFLYQRYIQNELTPTEQEEFDNLLNGQEQEQLHHLIDHDWEQFTEAELMELSEEPKEDVFQAVISDPAESGSSKQNSWYRIAAAAILLIGTAIAAYFAINHTPAHRSTIIVKADVAPFSQQAILKTGHGKTIVLDNIHQGGLAQYDNTNIQKNNNDEIAYSNRKNTDHQLIFDTLQVPAGGRPYHLKLADGSTVILNVASTLRYPENFRNNQKNNELELISGEAYFAIVHDQGSPLVVKAKGQLIEDIGTEFNVNTYGEEPANRTTLVKGAVSVNHRKLKPGQQAVINGTNLTVSAANLAQTVAWKDGYFRFNGENIQAIMRELARWYNIDVKYEGKITDAGYYIKISRSRNISEVLKVLERTNSVHFKIEGRRITVSSKK